MTNSEHVDSAIDAQPSRKLTANIKAAGCAAKISAVELREIVKALPAFDSPALLTSVNSFEDAAVYKLSEQLALVQTIDFFPPVVDDPYLYGRIAAANALSDIYAMGARPLVALTVFCFPTCDYPLQVAREILAGGASAVADAGAVLAGGHSIQASEPIFGLSVTGTIDPQKILTNGGAKDGDALVLTKRIGTGVLLLALKGEMITDSTRSVLVDQLVQLNAEALDVAYDFPIHGATDVTGFGLVGHLHEMAKSSNLMVTLSAKDVPILPEALDCAEQGLVPAGAYANRSAYKQIVEIDPAVPLAVTDLLFDPQTSGGLLFALPKRHAEQLADRLHQRGLCGAIIGEVKSGTIGKVEVI
jgi:selenide,water dikinase